MEKRPLFPLKIDKWDSAFFKKSIARLRICGKNKYPFFGREIKDLLNRAKTAGVKLVVISIEDPKPSYERALSRADMKLCGTSVNLLHNFKTPFTIAPVGGYSLRPFKKSDVKRICDIAEKAFRLSYLYRGGLGTTRQVDNYHRTWLKNQCGNKDYLVYVAQNDKEIAGFVTINLRNTEESARMSLMAVDKKHRGRGLGRYLIKTLLAEACKRRKCTHFRTQKNNRFALPIYEGIRCSLLSTEKVYFKEI